MVLEWNMDRQAATGAAPPAHAAGMAAAWGLRLTQEDDGRWRVADTPAEPDGPNPVHLQRQNEDLRETVAELSDRPTRVEMLI